MLTLTILILILNSTNIIKWGYNSNVISHSISYHQISRLTFLTLIFCFFLSLNSLNIDSLTINWDYSKIYLFNDFFQISLITQSLDIFLYLISIILILIINSNFRINSQHNDFNYNSHQPTFTRNFEYIVILLISLLGTTLLLSVNNFIALILCIELQSFSMYLIASFNKNHFKSQNAGIIYFLLGSLSSCFIFLGFFLIYANTGLLNLTDFYIFMSIPGN